MTGVRLPSSRRGAVVAAGLAALVLGTSLATLGRAHLQPGGDLAAIAPVCAADLDRAVVALSVDDGPSRLYTPPLLDVLEASGARATFFVVGAEAARNPDLVRLELRLGMEIGNHGWSHRDLTRLASGERRRELSRTQALLRRIGGETGAAPRLFRAPFGAEDSSLLALADDLGLTTVGWTVAVERLIGGLGLSPAQAAAHLGESLRPGQIVLAHDGGGDRPRNRAGTIETLRLLLPRLAARGIRVVPVGELLAQGDAVRATRGRWPWDGGFDCPRPAPPG